MNTRIWTVSPTLSVTQLRHLPALRKAAFRLTEGKLIAFPTETVYGLGADALNGTAVADIFTAKGRPADNPLIVHIGVRSQLADIASDIPVVAERLIDRFWPGPLTLVLPSTGKVSAHVTAHLPTVAVRMPAHPVAQALLLEADCPVAAPSANRSGRPSPTEAQHVLDDLSGRIFGVLDGGATGFGLESTVLDVTGEFPVLLRPGGVTLEQLRAVLGKVQIDPALAGHSPGQTPRSPGMKYRHYAPRADMTLVRGSETEMVERIRALTAQYQAQGLKVGVLTTEEHQTAYDADVVIACGRRDRLDSVARELYRALRQFDEVEVDCVLVETFPESGWGMTIMNRLRKAAGDRIL